ncbi:MAG TPA: hypothetical protein VJ907_04295 [Halanaerobiales bacterium]|nr:hypothetical protein [Halanaerobiales bacterium]
MIQFVTLNTITTDLLNIIRGAEVTQSEPISKRQLEAWVHEYRAKLLKQDLDKGKMPNPDYIQQIQALELEEVDESEGSIPSDIKTFRTKIQVPKTLDLNFKPGFMYVGTVDGREIQFVPESRSRWQKYNKYTGSDPVAYLKNGYIYTINDKYLRYLTVRGVFEVPPEVSHLNNPNETITDVTENSPYPIPINMLPTLKEMILKGELNIETRAFSDNKTDANDAVSPNYGK